MNSVSRPKCSRVLMVTLLVMFSLERVLTSEGDHSYFFQRCLTYCVQRNCRNVEEFRSKQSLDLQWLGWTCEDECEYMCMWPTVNAFRRDQLPVPQFHGKWPFVRAFGIEEPASTVFSVLNFLAHLGIFKFRREVPSDSPMYTVWTVYSMVALKAWFWCTLFHVRTTAFTQMMDCISGFALVLGSLLALVCRLLGGEWRSRVLALLVGSVSLACHAGCLALVGFDSACNAKVCMGVGLCSCLGWLYWCHQNRQHRYVWKCAVVMIGATAGLLLLNVWDFPPVFWVFDGHSLWRLATAALTPLWMSFITEDSRQLAEGQRTLDTNQEAKKTL